MAEDSLTQKKLWFSPHGTEWEAETYEEALEHERDSLVEQLQTAEHTNELLGDANETLATRNAALVEQLEALQRVNVHRADSPLRPVWYRIYRDASYEPTNAEARVICDRVRELEAAISRASFPASEPEAS